jgi:hypothetical protein
MLFVDDVTAVKDAVRSMIAQVFGLGCGNPALGKFHGGAPRDREREHCTVRPARFSQSA